MQNPENICIRTRALPRARQRLWRLEKLRLKGVGRKDGESASDAFTCLSVDGKDVYISQFMRQELDNYQAIRDQCFNKPFVDYKDAYREEHVKGATFTSWSKYIDSRVEYAGWRDISPERLQEYSDWKIAKATHTQALAEQEENPAKCGTYVDHTKNEITKFSRNLRDVLIAACVERRVKLETLASYLEAKIDVTNVMEGHLRTVYNYRHLRIGHYYGAAARYYKALTAENRPYEKELMQIANGNGGGLLGENYDQQRKEAKRKLAAVQDEIKELTADTMEIEFEKRV